MTVSSSLVRTGTLLAVCALVACNSGSSPQPAPSAASSAPRGAAPEPRRAKPSFVTRPADGTPLQTFVAREVERGRTDDVRVLVYVGASWCEPCLRFHKAVQNGELDSELAGTRFLEFDQDRDGTELEGAGYGSRLIPLLALPNPDGSASNLRVEGSIKGPEAVRGNLLPRLRAMLERAASTTP